MGSYLDNGVSLVSTGGGAITIKNAAGADVGWTYVADERDVPEYLGEKIVSAW